MNKKKIILSVIVAILIIFLIFFARKLYLINKIINNVAKNNEITNYRISWADEDYLKTFETDGNLITYQSLAKYTDDDTMYCIDKSEHKTFLFNYSTLTYQEFPSIIHTYDNQLTTGIYEEMSFKDKLIAVFTWEINTETVDGVKCYHICKDINTVNDGEEFEFWLNKDNYLKIRATKKEDHLLGNQRQTVFYSYSELNGVTRENINWPDVSGYTKLENKPIEEIE